MKGIHYLTNEQGERVAAQIDLTLYGDLWEDFYDKLLVLLRAEETVIPLEDFLAELKADELIGEV
jgi:hypothetical protein